MSISIHPEPQLTDEEFLSRQMTAKGSNLFVNPLKQDFPDVFPTFHADSEGQFMFSLSSVVSIFGESGSRKSLLLQTAVAEHSGAYIHLESSARGVHKRLQKMAFPIDNYDRYVFPETKGDVLRIVQYLLTIEPTIIGFDSFGPLASFWGGDTNKDMDVQTLFKEVFHPLRNAGHCVVVLDHIPKKTSNEEFAIGSQNKKSQVDIALKILQKKDTGFTEVHVAKDRDYVYEGRMHSPTGFYGLLELNEAPLRAVITIPTQEMLMKDSKLSVGLPTVERRRIDILKALRENGPMGKTDLKSLLGGNAALFDKSLFSLKTAGDITMDKGRDAAGNSKKVLISLAVGSSYNYVDPGQL